MLKGDAVELLANLLTEAMAVGELATLSGRKALAEQFVTEYRDNSDLWDLFPEARAFLEAAGWDFSLPKSLRAELDDLIIEVGHRQVAE